MNQQDDFRRWARQAKGQPTWVRVLVGIGVAAAIGVLFVLRSDFGSGADWGFKVAMAVAAVVAMAIVAPQFSTGDNADPNDWTDEIGAIYDQPQTDPRDSRDGGKPDES